MVAISLIVFLGILSILKPKSKAIFNLILLYMWIFYAFNTYSGDYISYEYVYSLIQSDLAWVVHFEPLFSLMMTVCIMLGLPFTGFQIVLATFYMVMVKKNIEYYTDYLAVTASLFMLFPFMWAASVLRAGVAGLIVIWGFKYLLSEEKNAVAKYVAWVVVATMFHTSSIFFIVFVFARRNKPQNLFIVTCLTSLIVGAAYRTGLIYWIFSQLTSNYKVLQWLNVKQSAMNLKGIVAEFIVLLCVIFVSRMVYKQWLLVNREENIVGVKDTRIEFAQLVYKCNELILVLTPLFLISDVWIRMLWEIFPLTIFTSVNLSGVLKEKRTVRRGTMPLVLLVLVAVEIMIVIYTNLPYRGTEIDVVMMFYNNSILGMLSI